MYICICVYVYIYIYLRGRPPTWRIILCLRDSGGSWDLIFNHFEVPGTSFWRSRGSLERLGIAFLDV